MTLVAKLSQFKTIKNSGLGSLFFIVLLLTACSPVPQRYAITLEGPIMGTDYRITLVSDTAIDERFIASGITQVMELVNQKMSTYLADSEVSQFNRFGSEKPFLISAETASVLKQSLDISAMSDGYFDITVGPLVRAWGFGADGSIEKVPDASVLAQIDDSVGFTKLQLQDLALLKADADVEIDLSAIAKGYAVDLVAEFLLQQSLSDFLINIGGELRASGTNVDHHVWRVGIERPEMLGGVENIVALNDMAVATSGDYRNFVVLEGKKYSHTIDPIQKRPVLHKLALVSVIHERASYADALATAMMAMGEVRAQQFSDKHGIASYFAIRTGQGDDYQIVITEQFMPYLQ